jgi:hypothetical protein
MQDSNNKGLLRNSTSSKIQNARSTCEKIGWPYACTAFHLPSKYDGRFSVRILPPRNSPDVVLRQDAAQRYLDFNFGLYADALYFGEFSCHWPRIGLLLKVDEDQDTWPLQHPGPHIICNRYYWNVFTNSIIKINSKSMCFCR